jgi:hypothetical protein
METRGYFGQVYGYGHLINGSVSVWHGFDEFRLIVSCLLLLTVCYECYYEHMFCLMVLAAKRIYE